MKRQFKINQRWIRLILTIAVVVIGVYVCQSSVWADVGNNVNHSSGGSSSGYSGSGSSSSSGSMDFYMIYMLMRLMFDNPILLVIVVILGGVFMLNKRRGYEPTIPSYSRGPVPVGLSKDYLSIQRLVEADPTFSEQMMIGKVNNMFMRLQLAWMNKRWEEARPFETDALFHTHQMQLEQYISSKRTNRIEEINISNTEVLNYYVMGQFEYLDVEIKARFLDYIVEDHSGRVLKGSDQRPVHMHYKWKLMRKKGVHTNESHTEATECPNCGANISINQAGKCEYCGSIVTQGDYDWVLSEIESLGQY
ncbi:MAG: TIM44-like domain-containing protein [Cellulosilyticaceae bacterium]